MGRRTKKVGSAGRFGSRYGVSLRNRFAAVEKRRKASYECPQCAHQAVKRKAAGIWRCRHCDLVFAGGAYVPKTTRARQKRSMQAPVEDEDSQPDEVSD